MIDVLHLIDTYRIGGPGKTIINSARFIDGTQYRIHVSSSTRPTTAPNEFATAVKAAGIPYLELQERRRFDLSSIARLRNYIRQHQIQILHTHSYRPDILGYAAVQGTQAAIVTTHHGWIDNNPRQRFLNWVAAQLCRRFDGVELVSEDLRRRLPPGLKGSQRVSVVHNAIVLDDFQPRGVREETRARMGVGAGETLLAVIGRLSPEKGCIEMVEAFRLLASRTPSARLVFVGEGPLEGELRQRVAAAGLQEGVRFMEHQRNVQPIYEAADLIVSPALTEGLSNVILESLACERPIVATRVGGNAEILEHGRTGFLVDAGQPDALADAIATLVDDPRLRAHLVEHGAARVRSAFTFEVRMRREEQFYQAVLERRNGRGASLTQVERA